MKKKVVIMMLIASMTFTACGNSTNATSTESNLITSETTPAAEPETATMEVEENLFDVTITLPASYFENATQEDLDKTVEENGYYSATINEDGSVTYVMSNKKHQEALEEYKASIIESFAEMIGSENYPDITDITVNDDCTVFTVTTKSTSLSMNESFSVLGFYVMGAFYNQFAGNPDAVIYVTFINEDSGEIINEANSSSLGQQ